MAIYNPKRARELEAAARLSESQRQRELARGQREQQALERRLGLVESLIGAAPKALEAYQAGEAQKILSGERGLEKAKPDNILEEIGQFITSPLEPGAKRMAKAAAAEMAPAEVAKLQPLTSKALRERIAAGDKPLDVPAERKEVSAQEFEKRISQAMPVEAAARGVLEESPVLQLLPEREREALAAGETQRVQAEQAAAEREAELFGLEKRKIEAEAGAKEAQAKKFLTEAESKKQQVAPAKMKELSKAIVMGVRSFAQDLKSDLNSTDPNVRGMAIDRLNEQVLLEAGTIRNNDGTLISQDSPLARAAASEAVAEISKELELPKLATTDLKEFSAAKNTIEEVASLVERRKKLGDFPVQAVDVIAQRFANATPEILGARNFIEEMRKLALESGMTNEQFSWLKDAQILKNRLITEEFRGTGAISDQERASVRDEVLTPIASYEQFRQRAYDTLKNVSNKFVGRVSIYRETNQIPSIVTSFADELNKVLGGDREKIALAIIGEAPPGSQEVAYELDEETTSSAAAKLGLAPGTALRGVATQGVDFLKDVISRAFNNELTEDQIEEIAPFMVKVLSASPAAPTSPAAPQTSQQQMQALPGTELAPTAAAPAGQVHIKITLPNGIVRYDTEDIDTAVKRREEAAEFGATIDFIQSVGAGR